MSWSTGAGPRWPNAPSSATGQPSSRRAARWPGCCGVPTSPAGAFASDIVDLDAADRPANVRWDPEDPVPYTGTKGAVLLHILEELFQHLGQMELTRDALVAAQGR